jgi:hypothetical protein
VGFQFGKPAPLLSAPMSAFASCGHEYTRRYAYVVCAMSRDAIEREKKSFSQNRKAKTQKSKDRKKKNKRKKQKSELLRKF